MSNSLSLGLRRPSERIHPGGHRHGKVFSMGYYAAEIWCATIITHPGLRPPLQWRGIRECSFSSQQYKLPAGRQANIPPICRACPECFRELGIEFLNHKKSRPETALKVQLSRQDCSKLSPQPTPNKLYCTELTSPLLQMLLKYYDCQV